MCEYVCVCVLVEKGCLMQITTLPAYDLFLSIQVLRLVWLAIVGGALGGASLNGYGLRV